jgi:hypothetical protein
VQQKDKLGSEAQFRKPRRARRVETSKEEEEGARVALLFSLTYQVVQHPTLYIGVHLSQLFM